MVRVTELDGGAPQVKDRRLVLFPCYWDCKRTVAAGRKVPMSHACEHVSVNDVLEALFSLGLPFELEARGCLHNMLCLCVLPPKSDG